MVPQLKEVQITVAEGRFIVTPIWGNVDRPNTGGFSCGPNQSLAHRLQKAIVDEAVWYEDPSIERDGNGYSYVNAQLGISMRHINAELKKLGY